MRLVLIILALLIVFIGSYRLGYRQAVRRASFKHCYDVGSWQEYQSCEEEFKRALR